MKTTMQLIFALHLGLSVLQAGAQQSAPGAAPGADAANREAALRGGRISPRQKAELERAALADTNQQAGASFLAGNRIKPGVTSLPSGVQYRVLAAGAGKRPTDASSVLCRYKGTLIDGKVFDKTDDRTPLVLNVAGLLPGLREAVRLMPVGSRWEIVVPPQLGYGARGSQGVGPNAVLTYVVELVGIK
jgi:FKBP-type peptidyl-prolyl cis-trans isomerase FklB